MVKALLALVMAVCFAGSAMAADPRAENLPPGFYTLVDHNTGEQVHFAIRADGSMGIICGVPSMLYPGTQPAAAAVSQQKPIDPFPLQRGFRGVLRRLSGSFDPRREALNNQQDVLYYNAAVNQYNANAGKQIMQPSNIPDPPSFYTPPTIIIQDRR